MVPTRFILIVNIASQTVSLFERTSRQPLNGWNIFPHPSPLPSDGRGGIIRRLLKSDELEIAGRALRGMGMADSCSLSHRMGEGRGEGNHRLNLLRVYRCSTSRFGIGQEEGSYRTPLGLHRVVEKIGGGWPAGTVFKGRQPVGYTWQGMPDAKITTRILWLEGLEPGFNRGGNVDSHARYIYLHGTGDQTSLGRPASCGCIHLADADLIPLFDRLPGGTLVWISEL
jgi:hypothetical protein